MSSRRTESGGLPPAHPADADAGNTSAGNTSAGNTSAGATSIASTSPVRRILLRPLLGGLVALVLGYAVTELMQIRWLVAGSRAELLVFHHYQRTDESVDVAFFGSSSTRHAIVPRALEPLVENELSRPVRIWNLALKGGSPLPAPVIVKELFEGPRAPRFFFLEVNPGYWSELRTDSEFTDTYWRWFAPPGRVFASLGQVPLSATMAGVRGLARGVEALWRAPAFLYSRAAKKSYRDVLWRRGGEHDPASVARAQPGEAALERPGSVAAGELGGEIVFGGRLAETLTETAQRAEERGVELVLINLPVQAEAMHYLDPAEYAAFMAWIGERALALDLRFYDLNAEPWRAKPNDWDGFIHLTPFGAREFGERLAQEVLVPLLAQPHAQDGEG